MFTIPSEDYLNYRLIMEGFYYDAEIEHITEIVKNNLYFAVLEGEQNKIIKNTHDTFYFSIDDELLYVNYYFDFGPLNISCLYKYCTKLNNYLQYAQGSKRVVHYTTSNPSKRVNAAFLIGSYAIIYLKREPKDIYHTLITTGGPFKSFVDASQGISQYTIRILDCFNALQKAFTFNFFNFDDFNVSDYDVHDKLQNGDMNWLLPRKFLAFIGPTDSELLNGHPPDFYIRYFVENDIKTVIRLNNKLYNAAVFTQSGIEHYDLFFPDGSVPTKQILIRFLELSENARAAVAVHCKAGLGRTGSLIGAYIIKHYRMTAREAIAWMRICRPGSVIGQQQGWLEKIENWLWRQGSQYRIHHFGDGDKIPHHKYGIYSKEWLKERDKVIRHVQRRRTETQSPKIRTAIENSLKRDGLFSIDPFVRNCVNIKKSALKSSYNSQKSAITPDKEDDNRKISKFLGKMQRNAQLISCVSKPIVTKDIYKIQDTQIYQNETSGIINRLKPKRLINSSKYKESLEFEGGNPDRRPETTKQKGDDFYDGRTVHTKQKKRNQSESREQIIENKPPGARIIRQFVENLEQTQGDKLNEIKAQRLTVQSVNDTNKSKSGKPKRRLSNIINADAFGKTKMSTSKKNETDTMALRRASYQQQHMYTSRS